uniref:Uncharacterized protein n=1 Tax=Ananas comosus var. bracteatus TaxID=296719 RepID=A0A6V7P9L2_ANACO|nr:unnamed protein product [Ananas comosus var. bracteatus]
MEILAAKGIIFVLTVRGLGAAFCRKEDEVIESLFYNKDDESLITLSLHASDNSNSWKCRTIPIESIRKNQLRARYKLFETESGDTIEFDVVNNKALIYSARNHLYDLFDMKDYSFKYSINEGNITEIKIRNTAPETPAEEQLGGNVPLEMLSVEDGTLLKSFKTQSYRNKQISFMELFGEKLLVKQENENLQIVDVRTSELIEVVDTEFFNPSALIFLYRKNLFMCFQGTKLEVWSFHGELFTSFEDHTLRHGNVNSNNIYITDDQEIIISYCKVGEESYNEEEDNST